MPSYEYRCRDCEVVFEQRRTMTETVDVVTCPAGHANVRRIFSVFASTGAGSSSSLSEAPSLPAGGGCCGGACGCGR